MINFWLFMVNEIKYKVLFVQNPNAKSFRKYSFETKCPDRSENPFLIKNPAFRLDFLLEKIETYSRKQLLKLIISSKHQFPHQYVR
jgi:hypothetical protein